MTIKNAKIDSTMLGGYDGHVGILTAYLYVDYGGAGQGFGGYGLDTPINDEITGRFIRREGCAWGMEFIRQILTTLEVEKWEDLPGTSIRVDAQHDGIDGIGHFIKDRWFYPKRDLKHLELQMQAA